MKTKDKKNILEERAARLAKLETSIQNEPYVEVVIFTLESEYYGIEPRYIQEIIFIKEITFLPNVPSFVCGLINMRRKVISVIDLKKILNIPTTLAFQKGMILKHSQVCFAILIDSVIGLQKVLLKNIQPTLPTLTDIKQEFLMGITCEGIVLLDGNKLLLSNQILVEKSL